MFKNLLLIINLGLLSTSIYGQNKVLDSLFIKLNKSISEEDQADYLNQIAYQFHRVNIDSAKHYAELALDIAQNNNLQGDESRALNILGIASIYKGDFQESIDYNLISYEIAKEINSNYHICIASNGLSICYDRINNSTQSILYGKIALEAAFEMRDTTFMSYILNNLSEIHYDEGNYNEAKKYTEQVISIGKETNDCKLLALAFLSMGKLQVQQLQLSEAKKNLNAALNSTNKCEDEYTASLVYLNLAKLKYNENDFDEANGLIDKSTSILVNIGEEYNLFENHMIKADILLGLKEDTEAIEYLLKGLKLSEKHVDLEFQNKYLEKLIHVYKAHRAYDKALTYSTQRHIIQDSIANMNKAVAMLELEKKYSVEKKEVEVELLTEQQEKNEQTIKSRTYLSAAASLFAALIGCLAFFSFLSLRRKAEYSTKLEKDVGERTKELQTSNRLLQKSNQELERFAYISSHDLKEPLKNINSFTKLIKKESISSNNFKINEYANILDNCSNQLNTLVSDILDYSMVKSDLKIQSIDLNHIVKQLNSDLEKTLDNNNAIIESSELPTIKSDKSSIYQIFKNLIENGIKYNTSNQPQINISTEENLDNIKLIFADNGIGIDSKYHDEIFMMFKRLHNKDTYPGSGIGLSTVKAVIDKLKGSISVKSKPNNGSKFIVTLPKLN